MARKETWAFLICGLGVVLCFHSVFYEYHFIDTDMTWAAAQQSCRLHYDDLATFTSMEDIQRVKRPNIYNYAWIGLFDDTASWKGIMGNESNSWRWSATGTTSPGGYQVWESGQPNFYIAKEDCVYLKSGSWGDADCRTSNYFYFVCFTGSLQPGSKQFILMDFFLNWKEAQAYCRNHHVDLAIIENESEFTTVSNLIGTRWVWIGLYRQPFRWSDNHISLFRHWANGEPDNKQTTEHCVVESSATDHLWLDAPCEALHRVICHRALKTRTTVVKVVFQTAADLANPANIAQIPDKVTAIFRTLGISDVKVRWKKLPIK